MAAFQENQLRIMTSNVWGDYFGNVVNGREDQLVEVLLKYRPDIIGLQEMTPNWYNSKLFKVLEKEYALVGAVLGSHINYVPLAYNKERFNILEYGFRRYNGTTDRSKAVTYAVLYDKSDGHTLAVCNTHFWWKSGPEHDQIRIMNAHELTATMKDLQSRHHCIVFAFGDLNSTITSDVFTVFLQQGVIRLYDLAEEVNDVSSHHGNPSLGEDGCYHGRETMDRQEMSIDHIVALLEEHSCQVRTYQVVLDQNALDASDHSPVYVDVMI